jgi:hypothetical protein
MAEKDTIFSSKIKYKGVFSFQDFYKFCYDWLSEEMGLDVSEEKYTEKLKGNSKDIEVDWICEKKITDYFKYEIKVSFDIQNLEKVEITQGNVKVNSNKGGAEVKIKGIIIKDYEGKFEKSAFQKFLRGIYEKWVITSRIDQMEGKLVGMCDEFLAQTKAYLDLEGKK